MNIRGDRSQELTGVQEAAKYNPKIDLACDFVMVYGADNDFADRVEQWKERGYVVHFMTGVAWGGYQDFIYRGTYDGSTHEDIAQVNQRGKVIGHGYETPYICPSVEFADYLTQKLKLPIDCGVEAIHLEEPEFWVRAGYSDAFKREWELYYREPWIPPHSSPDAQYRASKLKSYLYTRTIDRICSALRSYAKIKYNKDIRFYVPTHSLINYASWNIVSPESKLIDLPTIDGYIAQIWTGTSRTENCYDGVTKERTFETAYLEYGIMQELTRGTGRRMWFLHDPIEDNSRYEWDDYKYNYIKTLVASLFHHNVYHYEITPWPNRVYNGKYPARSENAKPIPQDYAIFLNVVANTLRDMKQDEVAFSNNNSVVGVLIADSSMYQKVDFSNEVDYGNSYTNLDAFFGMCLPLLKYGLPVRPVQLDNIRRFPAYLDDYNMLLLSYEFMKPEYPDIHNAIGQWVRDGGILIYIGDGKDPYHKVREWWNQGKKKYDNPAEHLFESIGVSCKDVKEFDSKIFNVGKGHFVYINDNPADFTKDPSKAEAFRTKVRELMDLSCHEFKWDVANYFLLRRGPYVIANIMTESVNDDPLVIKGNFVNLLDAQLPIVKEILVEPDESALLYDINKAPMGDLDIFPLAASCRVELPTEGMVEESRYKGDYTTAFTARGPQDVTAVIRFKYTKKPSSCVVWDGNNELNCDMIFDEETKTFKLVFPNSVDEYFIFFK